MLSIISSVDQLNIDQLLAVYIEGNTENGAKHFPFDDPHLQLQKAEEQFLSYLRFDFFQNDGAMYAVWADEGLYKAALRLEPYLDGLLLHALETAPDDRRRGHAYHLISAVLDYLATGKYKKVYSHVKQQNKASLGVHYKCGFQVIDDTATLLDGTVSANYFTLCYYL